MKEIFEQYGGAIITVIAIIALATLITLVIGGDNQSPVYKAFNDLMTNFYTDVQSGFKPGTSAVIFR